ncbi:unnamed protein product [Prunus armeniaca]
MKGGHSPPRPGRNLGHTTALARVDVPGRRIVDGQQEGENHLDQATTPRYGSTMVLEKLQGEGHWSRKEWRKMKKARLLYWR